MFPNVRLMIVAVLASILGISCALGLFAEFRVSHDSFLRESNASTPLQLGSNDGAPGRIVNTAAPFEFRFQAPPPPAAVEALGSPQTPDRAAVVETPQLAPGPAPESEPAANPTAAVNAPSAAPDVAAEPATVPASLDHATEAPNPAATGSIADQNSQPDAPQDRQQDAKPKTAGDLAARTPAASPSTEVTAPKSAIAPASPAAAAPEKRKRVTLRRRPIIVRRIQRTRQAAQDFSTMQPAFQWTLQSGIQSPQPVRRRVIIMRVRPVRKPVVQTTTPQTTVSTTSPVNAPE
jgi:hypothetical protein